MISNNYPSRVTDYNIEVEELDFSDEEEENLIGERFALAEIEREQTAKDVRKAGLTEATMPGQGPTADDLTPETLIEEDGALSPYESGDGLPNDQQLSIVDEDEIGGGSGLDEAELARVNPLDKKPWRPGAANTN